MNNPNKLELYVSEEVRLAIQNCKSGTLKLLFSIRNNQITGCIGASIGPAMEEVEEKV